MTSLAGSSAWSPPWAVWRCRSSRRCGRCPATTAQGRRGIEVRRYGDRPVWDEVVDAYFQWVNWGQPGRSRFGMTVTPDGQQVWLDEPSRTIG
ncbi:hypothetical protein [Streptosporangium carneum]|uniref:Uncharacterized protein n=1 Tax=Streptosporangium carneum TaxID=47481 RepID=A0A9W6I1C0_9ACTN|nr:hypothetical protein [Streptosporangium carneum]GLK09155.1 hypothetical protein GCM10017600_25610 [Streptosporangium carneum]